MNVMLYLGRRNKNYTIWHTKRKSSGLGRMTVEILVHHWGTIQVDLLATMLRFFSKWRMLWPLNHTFLVVIPKRESLTTLDDYQPILCLGVTYKVILWPLANRMEATLQNFIVDSQMALIKGCCISDCIKMARIHSRILPLLLNVLGVE